MAQITKLNLWEFSVTKQSIVALFVPNVKTLASCIDLIQDLQSTTLNEPVFVLVASFPFFGLYHCLYPPGHTLNQVSTNLLWYSIWFYLHLPPKAHPHQQEVPIDIGLPLVVLPPIFKRAEVMWLHTTSGQSPCSIGTILGPSWRWL